MKNIYSLLIILAMGLGLVSCVENVESESVKAIRNAKATEILALADLHKAQAAADSLLAKAEAALLEAQARYQNAMAEGIELNNEIAKATLELEIERIKAELESELNRLMEQIARYKDDVRDELYSQMSYWINKLNTESSNLITLESAYASYYPYDVAEDEADVKESIALVKDMIAYYEAMVAEYNKYIEANSIDWTEVYKATAAIEMELDALNEKAYYLEDEIRTVTDDLYDDVEWSNQEIFDILEMLEYDGPSNVLDIDSDDILDEDEWIIEFNQPYSAFYTTFPSVRINEVYMTLISKVLNDTFIPDAVESSKEVLGTEKDKFDNEKPYEDQTEYAVLNYWAERYSTFTNKFNGKVWAAVDKVNAAVDAWNAAEIEEKDAAEAALVAALDALDKYTMIGTDPEDPANGSFTLFLAGTYDTDSYPVAPLDPASVFTTRTLYLSDGSRTYYTINENDLMMMDFTLAGELADAKDNVAYAIASLEQLEILALDYNTLEEVIYAYAENHNAEIKEAEALITEFLALEDEINAKDAELEAAMTALVTAEQYENYEAIEALKGTVAFYEGLLVTLKTELATLESGSSSTIIFESLARAINTTKDNIERIHAIIDQIEAEMNALLTTEE